MAEAGDVPTIVEGADSARGAKIQQTREASKATEQNLPSETRMLLQIFEDFHAGRRLGITEAGIDSRSSEQKQQDLKLDRQNVMDLPPEAMSLLIKNLAVNPDEISPEERAQIRESVRGYGKSWTLEREIDPNDPNVILVKIVGMGGRALDTRGGPDEVTSIPKYIMENSRLNPEWRKVHRESTDAMGYKYRIPELVSRVQVNNGVKGKLAFLHRMFTRSVV